MALGAFAGAILIGGSNFVAVRFNNSAVADETFALPDAGKTQIAVVYLVAATVGLFLMVLMVVQRWTASSTSYILS